MAVIEVKFDTKEKVLNASIDGKKVENVSEVWFMGFNDNKGSVEFKTTEFEEEEAYVKVTRIYANEQGEDVIKIENCDPINYQELGQILLKRPL
jgi:hypothetical protein